MRRGKVNRPHGQAVKTSPFHGGNSGSSPDGVTKSKRQPVRAVFCFVCIAELNPTVRTSAEHDALPIAPFWGSGRYPFVAKRAERLCSARFFSKPGKDLRLFLKLLTYAKHACGAETRFYIVI